MKLRRVAFDPETSHAASVKLPGDCMEEPGTEKRTGEGGLSWPVFLLTLVAITSSLLSVLSLYQLISLRAEVDAIKSEVWRRREEGYAAKHADQVRGDRSPETKNQKPLKLTHSVVSFQTNNLIRSQELLHYPQHGFALTRRKRLVSGTEALGRKCHVEFKLVSPLFMGQIL